MTTLDDGTHAEPGPSLPTLVALHFVPGLFVFFAYWILGGPLSSRGFPPGFVLNLIFAAVSVPYIVTFLAARRGTRDGNWLAAVRFRRKLRVWQYVLLVPLFLAYAILVSVVFAPVSATLSEFLSTGVPDWFLATDAGIGKSPVPIGVVFAVALLIDGFANPIAEELYFRGYLLPRLTRLGALAPLVHGILFASIHLWQPQNIPMLVVLVVPLYYAVWKLRCVYLSIAVHCTANVLGVLLAVA